MAERGRGDADRGGTLRTDPLNGQRVIVAPARVERPGAWGDGARTGPPLRPREDPDAFAAGNERLTPPELAAVGRPEGAPADGPGWTARAIPNRYPALLPDAPDPPAHHAPELLGARPARGHHEVIVSSPDPVCSLADLAVERLAELLAFWQQRLRAHRDAGAACVHLWVNEGAGAGASLDHSHAQLVALPFVPELIARERERFGAYAARTGGFDLLGDLVREELASGERVIARGERAVLLAAYASPQPYGMLIAPRQSRPRFEDDDPAAVAALLHDGLRRLRAVTGTRPPLNLWLRTAPAGADHFCWQLQIQPRLTGIAGIELGAGLALNIVAPERAARELRDAAAPRAAPA